MKLTDTPALGALLLLLLAPAPAAAAPVPQDEPAGSEAPAPAPQDEPAGSEAAAPPAPETEEGLFFETVDVKVINVDVWVTDKDGNPVTGLTRDDFEIFENKRPVAITNFFAVESGRPVAGAAPPVEGLEAGPRPPMVPLPEEQQLSLVIYIDNFNIRPFNRNRVFRRLREFLHDHIRDGDRVMLVSYDRSLHYRHPFTSDAMLVANALGDLEKMTGYAVHRDSDRRDIIRDIDEAESVGEVGWRVRQYAESLFNDLRFTLGALGDLMGTLAGIPGRKAILYVSDGLEMSPGEDLYHALNQKFHASGVLNEAREFNAARRFRELAAQANTDRITFYTIDAAGLRVYGSTSVERAAPTTPLIDTFVDSVHISNLQSSLIYMARETGGRAVINTNDVGNALDEIARDFENYYSLGYSPSHAGDGRYYSIEVKLKKKMKGVDLRHREGYRDKSVYTRMADGTTASLMYGLHRNPLEVTLQVGEGRRDDKGLYLVPVAVDMPLDKVVLVEREGAYVGRLKLFFSAMDAEGGMSDVTEVPIPVRIPNEHMETALQGPVRLLQTELRMRQGGHRVAVGVRDEIGAAESFFTRNVVVGSG